MVFWHVGGTLAVVRYVFRDPAMDLRFVILGSLLPDLIDKPIGTLLFVHRFRSGRIFSHTLLFSLVLMTMVMALTSRGTPARRAWLGVPIGSLVHLVLDGMWAQPETFWWPFLGWSFPGTEQPYWTLAAVFGNPVVLLQEALGLAYLVYLWRKARLSQPKRGLDFLRTGRLGGA